jgi:hypothetical protein
LSPSREKGGFRANFDNGRKRNIAAEVRRRFSRLFLRAAFVFEPATPRLVSYYVGQTLKKWKQQNLLLDYKTRTRRIGKFHYKTQIDVDLNSNQTAYILDDWTNKLKKARRWFNA